MIIKSELKAYEVVGIIRAKISDIDEYSKALDHGGISGNIKPVGVVQLKAWEGPGIEIEDESDDDGDNQSDGGVLLDEESQVQTFWVEDEILKWFFVGLKLELKVHELNIGLKFFDTIVGLYPSFLTILPNEMVIDSWKEPGKYPP
jgi:hypothetical protein